MSLDAFDSFGVEGVTICLLKIVLADSEETETRHLVDDRNPTGYAQVLEERDSSGDTTVTYTYGLDLVSQNRGAVQRYFGYDGLGTVRYLTTPTGAIDETFTYDAFGILITSGGTAPDDCNYRYTGEQWDSNLGLYYLRARYLNPTIGRFWTMDSYEGEKEDPLSLHKYLYCADDPVNNIDPSGQITLTEIMSTIKTIAYLGARTGLSIARVYAKNAKKREWVIWRVQCKPFGPPRGLWRHTYIWAQNIKTRRALAYHVLAAETDIFVSKYFNKVVPGLFVVLPQPQVDRLGSFRFPIKSKIPVMILTRSHLINDKIALVLLSLKYYVEGWT